MYRNYRRENRDKNSYKRDLAILANSQKTILRKERVLSVNHLTLINALAAIDVQNTGKSLSSLNLRHANDALSVQK